MMEYKRLFLKLKQIIISGFALVLILGLAPQSSFADELSNVVDITEISTGDLVQVENVEAVDEGLDELDSMGDGADTGNNSVDIDPEKIALIESPVNPDETAPIEPPDSSEEAIPIEPPDDPETPEGPEVEVKPTWQTVGVDRVLVDKDGNRLTGWQEVDGETYYFNAIGILQYGWQSISGSWYHFSKTGALDRSQWIYDRQKWYYVNDTGVMAEGWLKESGFWYWLQPGSGAMKTGWLKDSGKWYFLNTQHDGNCGAMKTGWYKVAGTWYYSNASGAMQTGWLKDDGTWYYLMSSGAMKTGWLKVGGIWYDFKSSGALDVKESAIWQLEEELANNPYSNGKKYENALIRSGGTLTNGKRGLWCVNYLWWGFYRIGMNKEVWGSTGLQVDPDHLRNEAKSLGLLYTSMDGIQRGDIMFTYFSSWRPGITASHGAMVTKVSGDYVTVIEGNMSPNGCLRTYTFNVNDGIMRGYYRPAY